MLSFASPLLELRGREGSVVYRVLGFVRCRDVVESEDEDAVESQASRRLLGQRGALVPT